MYENARTVRCLVIAQWLLGLVGIAVDLALESTLPNAIREYSQTELSRSWGLVDYFLGLWTVGAIAASIGLILSQKWARSAYAVASIGAILLLPLGTNSVAVLAAQPFYQASTLINGAVLGVLLVDWLATRSRG